jgi:hypothetical protein
MQIRFICALWIMLSPTPALAEPPESVAHGIGWSARRIHDSVQEVNQTAASEADRASEWIGGHLSGAGESISATAKSVAARIDLFFSGVRQGYEGSAD